MNYEQKHKEALRRARKWFNSPNITAAEQMSLEDIFPELKESEDERIRNFLIDFIKVCVWTEKKDQNCPLKEECIAWLEKQKHDGKKWISEDDYNRDKEQTYKDGMDEVLDNPEKYGLEKQDNKDEGILVLKDQIESLHAAIKALKEVHKIELEKQGEQKSIVIIPKFKVGDIIHNKKEEYEVNTIKISEIKEDRYISGLCYLPFNKQDEWELVGQKPTDKVEPKFKVGDWVIDKQGIVHQIANVIENVIYHTYGYDIAGGGYFNDNTEGVRLWTIQDAKEGDVIYLPNGDNEYYFFIFKGIENTVVMSFAHFYQYNDGTSEVKGTIDNLSSVNDVFQPATKEQCELLFSKMKDAGYMWDTESKQLLPLKAEPNGEHNFKWSEKDEIMISAIKSIIVESELEHARNCAYVSDKEILYNDIREWLKSLRPQNTWKPSEEQMEALANALSLAKNCGEENAFDLRTLYEQLKKLREE